MKKKFKRLAMLAAFVTLGAGLASCGGNDTPQDTTTPTTPTTDTGSQTTPGTGSTTTPATNTGSTTTPDTGSTTTPDTGSTTDPNTGILPTESVDYTTIDRVDLPADYISNLKIEDVRAKNQKNVYVSPTGTKTGDGTKANPYDIVTAFDKAEAGENILLIAGTYKYDFRLTPGHNSIDITNRDLDVSGEPGRYITVAPENLTDEVIFDFSGMIFDDGARGIQVYTDYWYFYNVQVTGAGDNGLYIAGSHNIVDKCQFYNNRDTGLQLGRASSSDDTIDKWPSYNLIRNCTSFANYDDETLGENADGFAAKLTIGHSNIFDGCIAYRNSDDGWDMYAKTDSGNIGTVYLYNCVSFENGYLPYIHKKNYNDPTSEMSYDTTNGDGIGFKLGGSTMEGDIVMENCMAFDNKLHGIGDNSNPGFIQVTNVTAYNNCSGLNADGTISAIRGIDGIENKSNNIDLARSTASYNSYYGVVSYTNNQSSFNAAKNGFYNEDKFRGSVAYSIFNTGYKGGVNLYKTIDTDYVDASSYHNERTDVYFEGGKDYTELSDASFAEIASINAKCDTREDVKDLLVYDTQFRNADGSVNMHNHLKIVDEKLLKYANGSAIGCDLSKSKIEEYNHPEYFSFKDTDELTISQVTVLSGYAAARPITRLEATYQDFDLPTLFNACVITWTSDNEDVIKIGKDEDISASSSVFVTAKVYIPNEETKVKLTAEMTFGNARVVKEFEVTVKTRTQKIDYLKSTGADEIRVNLYSSYYEPTIYAVDSASFNESELKADLYDIKYTYKYAADTSSTYLEVDGVYSSVPGVYQVTAEATMKNDPSNTATYTYYVYIVDPDCSIAFKDTPVVTLSATGFVVSGNLTNVEGKMYALTSKTEIPNVTDEYIVNNTNCSVYDVKSSNVVAEFEGDNENISGQTQYYIYYCVLNDNQSNMTKSSANVLSASIKNVSISTKDEFYKLARNGSHNGQSYDALTIFALANDLDFEGYNWDISKNTSPTTFTGLFNGCGHTVKNLEIIDNTAENATLKYINIFFKIEDGTLMNINFDNIKMLSEKKVTYKQESISAFDPDTVYYVLNGAVYEEVAQGELFDSSKTYYTKSTSGQLNKQVGIIGELQGGYVHKVNMTNIAAHGYESTGALIGIVTGKINTVTQCQLVNPTPTAITVTDDNGNVINTYDFKNNPYVIATYHKYAGGIVGNCQKNSDQDYVKLYVSNCLVDAFIGDGQDDAGNTGGIVGRAKNDVESCVTSINHCIYYGWVIAKGQYNAGIIGDFDNGLGQVYIDHNYAEVVFVYDGTIYKCSPELQLIEDVQKYAHKNSNPIVGRATSTKAKLYVTSENLGTWQEYYSKLVASASTCFQYSYYDDEGNLFDFTKIGKDVLESKGGLNFDFTNLWEMDSTGTKARLKF